MKKRTFYYILAFVVFINLPLWDFFTQENYYYSNSDGTYRFEEISGKGYDFLTVCRNYAVFLYIHPEKDKGDNRLYRNFTLKPWRFWEWREMIFHSDRYRLPYLDPATLSDKHILYHN